MSKWKNKTGRLKGDEAKERCERVKALLSELRSFREIVEILMDEYQIAQSTAYQDVKRAKEQSFTAEARDYMQNALIEGYRRTLRANMNSAKPRWDVVIKTLAEVRATLKLEVSPEELMSDAALAEQVAKATIENMHLWSVEHLCAVRDKAAEIVDARLQMSAHTAEKMEPGSTPE